MQSVAVYGRLVARAIVAGIHSNGEFQLKSPRPKEPVHFVTGSSGFSKFVTKTSPLKKWTFGDDAYFIARNKTSDVIGIADGVGGWRNYGVDPSAFPRTLMATCERMVHEGRFRPQAPASVIEDSYQELMQQKMPLIGSSTACIVSLHREERTIYTANLGDSGYLLIRDNQVVHRSQEQQHYFNTPYQLSVVPPSQEGLVLSDSPDMAESNSHAVEEGDIILLGTDGLFDNMTDMMLVEYVSKLKDLNIPKEEAIQTTASSIAQKAYQLSFDPDYLSPFAISAIDAGIELTGGKPDDITVVVARVTNLPDT
ncbi:protein phosphatase PTC7 homolog [Patella vulgata]|uniref:protein phosphatase PTC7 homolog n=1 Tax=Patella vulgata TaxID=6465 RepID=UPI00217FD08A|nr:protein phosphatase PTC7 homolog [Patella vulgata]